MQITASLSTPEVYSGALCYYFYLGCVTLPVDVSEIRIFQSCNGTFCIFFSRMFGTLHLKNDHLTDSAVHVL